MRMQTFAYHVNKEKNDFAAWIRGIIGDVELADKLSRKRDKASSIELVSNRIKALQKALSKR